MWLKHYGTHLLSFDNFRCYSGNASLLLTTCSLERASWRRWGGRRFMRVGFLLLLVPGICVIDVRGCLSPSTEEWGFVWSPRCRKGDQADPSLLEPSPTLCFRFLPLRCASVAPRGFIPSPSGLPAPPFLAADTPVLPSGPA